MIFLISRCNDWLYSRELLLQFLQHIQKCLDLEDCFMYSFDFIFKNLYFLCNSDILCSRSCRRTLSTLVQNALENVENKILEVLDMVGEKVKYPSNLTFTNKLACLFWNHNCFLCSRFEHKNHWNSSVFYSTSTKLTQFKFILQMAPDIQKFLIQGSSLLAYAGNY